MVARDSIADGLRTGRPSVIDPKRFRESLQVVRATFVTLQINRRLRGCIGMLQATRPLVVDVAANAWAAAFKDPRFPPVNIGEQMLLEVHLSVLSPAEPMTFTSEAHLLSQIRPGIDGLILEYGRRRGTFLPSVWESLPTTDQFWSHLKNKAGLPTDHWSDTLKVSRYTTESIES